jgi:hypothetical protein
METRGQRDKKTDAGRLIPFLIGEARRSLSFPISGTSMLRLLQEGVTVVIEAAGRGELRRGDVFLFREEGRLIVHRLVGVKTAGGQKVFCQKGDNLSGWSWISGDAIIGRAAAAACSGAPLNWSAFPWTWINAALGCWGGFYVASVSFLSEGKALVFAGRSSWITRAGAVCSGLFFASPDFCLGRR